MEKSPTSSTLAFLCRLGSAWNSRVTKLSTSRRLEAWTKVSPLMTVSTVAAVLLASVGLEAAAAAAVPAEPAGPVAEAPVPVADNGVCRMTNVKVKVSSSSLGSFRRKDGPVADGASGS